ncbi:InlB B-repeat-containing protein [Anaerorhabdus sp.]|uniref:InlB B-repeat-containing protein n=1 Tax=Anaerorhabdus sp. TaxID=1872524 RepID=UPI002FC9E15E
MMKNIFKIVIVSMMAINVLTSLEVLGEESEVVIKEEEEIVETINQITLSPLDDEIMNQKIEVGDDSNLILPKEIKYKVINSNEEFTLSECQWKSIPDFNINTQGNYIFYLVLPDKFASTDELKISVDVIMMQNISEEVEVEENPQLAMNILNNVYSVKDHNEFNTAVSLIEQSSTVEATILLTTDNIDVAEFSGIVGKKITIKSSDGNSFSLLNMGTNLKGDLVLDNIKAYNSYSSIYANGHLFETTEFFSSLLDSNNQITTIKAIYGGGNKVDVNTSTKIILRGGRFANLYGGGYDANVNGDTDILIDYPTSSTGFIGNFFGGGLASSKSDKTNPVGIVKGNVNINIRSGSVGYLFGGGDNQADASLNTTREPARVFGDINLIVGYEGAPKNTAKIGTSMNSCGGSRHSTVNNINVTLQAGTVNHGVNSDGSYSGGSASTLGAGENDDVLGVIKFNVKNGAKIGRVFGTGENSVNSIGSGGSKIYNQNNEEYAIHIVYDDGVVFDASYHNKAHGINLGGSQDYYDEIKGNALIEIISGDLDCVVLDNENNGNNNFTGQATILVKGGRVGHFWGNESLIANSKIIYSGCGDKDNYQQTGYVYRLGNVLIENKSFVEIDSKNFEQFGKVQFPLQTTPNLTIIEDSSLITRNSETQPKSVVMDKGTWRVKGKVWVHDNINSQNSTIIFDRYFETGYKHRDDANYTSFTSNNDWVINWFNTIGGRVSGTLVSDGSHFAFKEKVVVTKEFNGSNNEFRLPVIESLKNYPSGNIPIHVEGKVNGVNEITTVDPDNYLQEKKPTVGDNYLINLKGNDENFILGNTGADCKDLYLMFLDDPNSSLNNMWEVATGRVVTFDKNGGEIEANPKKRGIEITDINANYTIDKLPKNPERNGYIFVGWNTKSDGTGQAFSEKSYILESMTVYAQWKKQITPTPDIPGGNNNNEVFTKDECGNIFDKWGNIIYKQNGCILDEEYKVPNTSVN